MDHNSERHQLEALVDRLGLANVLGLLSEVCGEKAQHLRENWQDENMARVWDRARTRVEKLSNAAIVRAVS